MPANIASLTQYTLHASVPSWVNWPPSAQNQLVWKSAPENDEHGKVAEAGIVTPASSQTAECFTDCSGFVTSIFTSVNQSAAKTAFQYWSSGASIPEAGCSDPAGNCQVPNQDNYYRYFTQQINGFTSVTLSDLMPGDIIAFAAGPGANDTGHVMLVVATAALQPNNIYLLPDGVTTLTPNTNATDTTLVLVVDETQEPHSCDWRAGVNNANVNSKGQTNDNIGIGMGIVELYLDQSNTLQFCWRANNQPISQSNLAGSMVALGRASAAT